jgi:nucleoside-diphosphate-sugar epimerase
MGVMKNVYATHNVAYLCAKYNKWMIYASTVCVYGNQDKHPETEDTTLPNPSELYACSKYAGEWIVKGYGKNYGMPWTIQRFATIYGEGMRPALGMHIFFRQAMAGEPITVHGDGLQDRTLTHIDDLVRGIVAPLDHETEAQGEIFNLSTDLAVSAKKMAEDIKALTKSASVIVFVEQRDNQTYHEDFDVNKARLKLGWEAKVHWENGLEKTYEWMKTQV